MTTKKSTTTKKTTTKATAAKSTKKAENTVSYRPNFMTLVVSIVAGGGLVILCLFALLTSV